MMSVANSKVTLHYWIVFRSESNIRNANRARNSRFIADVHGIRIGFEKVEIRIFDSNDVSTLFSVEVKKYGRGNESGNSRAFQAFRISQ